MADLFNIIFKPHRTLDKLLREGSMKKSWQATWILVAAYAVFYLLYFLLGANKIFAPFEDLNREFGLFQTTGGISMAIALVLWLLTAVWMLVDAVLSRFWFAWYVRMGIRMVGGQQYASLSPEEKHEKSRLVQLIQPYTYSICVIGAIISGLLSLLVLPKTSPLTVQPDAVQLVTQMIGSSVSSMLSLGALAYCIVQRVFAIRKIYGVSGTKAFWGPVIPYAITYVLLFLIVIAFVVLLIVFSKSIGGI